ncbi:MAG: hypothetical protein SGPRY_004865 [Prymnesium sp.]
MSRVLGERHGAQASAAAAAWPDQGSQAEEEAVVCALGVTSHVQSMLEEAKPGEDAPPELGAALEAALETAIHSLTCCQSQQAQLLQREVQRLKAEFRQRLAELEADFVVRAEALSSELASSVAECKGECEHHVAQHAAQLTSTIRSLRQTPFHAVQVSDLAEATTPSHIPPLESS